MTTTKIELPNLLCTVEGGYAADVAAIIEKNLPKPGSSNTTSGSKGQPAPACNEAPLEVPTLNFEAVSHVSGPTLEELSKEVLSASYNAGPAPRVANYAGLGPVPGDCEEALPMPAINFAKQTESFTVPITGKPALPVGETAMALPVFR